MTNRPNKALVVALIGPNVISVPRIFVKLTGGDASTALLLAQIVYWSDRVTLPDGWFYKTNKQWEEELGLTSRVLDRCRRDLEKLNLIETKLAGMPAMTHYRLHANFMDVLERFVVGASFDETSHQFIPNVETSFDETSKQDSTFGGSIQYTETTAEITAERFNNANALLPQTAPAEKTPDLADALTAAQDALAKAAAFEKELAESWQREIATAPRANNHAPKAADAPHPVDASAKRTPASTPKSTPASKTRQQTTVESVPLVKKDAMARAVTPQQAMVGAIAEVCQLDLRVQNNQATCGKGARQLIAAGYEAQHVRNFGDWWLADKFRREHTPVPKLFGDLLPKISQGAHYAARVRVETNSAETPQAARLREARGTGGVREA